MKARKLAAFFGISAALGAFDSPGLGLEPGSLNLPNQRKGSDTSVKTLWLPGARQKRNRKRRISERSRARNR